MNEQQHKQRMDEILKHEQDYRQRSIENLAQAHDDIDYLYTQVNLLLKQIQKWQDLGEHGMGIICNSQPDKSLNAEHREGYWIAMQKYLDTYHEIPKLGQGNG